MADSIDNYGWDLGNASGVKMVDCLYLTTEVDSIDNTDNAKVWQELNKAAHEPQAQRTTERNSFHNLAASEMISHTRKKRNPCIICLIKEPF